MTRKPADTNFNDMSADRLSAYIMDMQHPYVKKTFATSLLCFEPITENLDDEMMLKNMTEIFQKLRSQITNYLEDDERTFFIFLRSKKDKTHHVRQKELQTIIKDVRAEHQVIKKLFSNLRSISHDYSPPAGTDPVLKLCYAQLFNFEQDMLKYLFLKEEVLLPKLLQLNY